MSRRAEEELELSGKACRTEVCGFDRKRTQGPGMEISVWLTPRADERKKYVVHAQVTEDPAASYVPVDWARHKRRFPHLSTIPFEHPVKGKAVDMLIGMDTPELLCSLIPDIGGRHREEPIARLTRLGWVAGGPMGHTEGAATMFANDSQCNSQVGKSNACPEKK